MHINPSADPVSRSVKIMADVPNPDGELRGGTFVKGRIRTGQRAGVLQIPRIALLSWDVERSSGRGVRPRRRHSRAPDGQDRRGDGELVEVVEGVVAGDRVVTRGGFNLRPGDRVQVVTAQGA